MRTFVPILTCIAALLTAYAGVLRAQDLSEIEDGFVRLAEEGSVHVVAVSSRFVIDIDDGSAGKSDAEPGEDGMDSSRTMTESNLSGVVLSKNGCIMTCRSAIEGADEIEVTLYNGNRYMATVVGSDSMTDLALLKIDCADGAALSPVVFGEPKSIRPGAWVMAIGNPFGLSRSASFGIISGTDRIVASPEMTFTGMLQTTAPVNPGDAGGLLLNMKGEMVGIVLSTFQRAPSVHNIERFIESIGRKVDVGQLIREVLGDRPDAAPTVKIGKLLQRVMEAAEGNLHLEPPGPGRHDDEGGRHGFGSGFDSFPVIGGMLGAEGINFAVPVDTVRFVYERLVQQGKVKRGWLGISVQPIDDAMRTQLEIPKGDGVVVTYVLEESPAAAADVRVWDVVLAAAPPAA
ncbi:MAG: trypsin-like peptidase domain-containing protein, partial [Planctomycetota bacterium]|nr:trypsin-like peptidase domain-containing protein [Planctomycetota bacterium]